LVQIYDILFFAEKKEASVVEPARRPVNRTGDKKRPVMLSALEEESTQPETAV
jgi:hypothetical protein